MKLPLLAAFVALIALPAAAQTGVQVIDPYARVIGPSGAAYFRIVNDTAQEDTLISATSPDAGMVMLMNDHADANGVMKMTNVPDGFAIKPGEERLLASVGDHVMLMSPTRKLKNGDTITLTLTFKNAGAVTVTLPVDNKRLTEPGNGPTTFDAHSAGN